MTDAVFISRTSESNSRIQSYGIYESDRYIVQFDGFIIQENLRGRLSYKQLFDSTTITELFADVKKINNLPIRNFYLLLWDKKEKKLLTFRDHIGIRPLFYYEDQYYLIMSSEIDLIRSLSVINIEISEEWIADALVNLPSSSAKTFYSNINLLEPGQYFFYSQSKFYLGAYYNLINGLQPTEWSGVDLIDKFREKLKTTIESHIKDFTSIGAELSGGLDSSALVSIGYPYAKKNGIPFHTFSSVLSEIDKLKYYPFSDESKFGSELVKTLGISSYHKFSGENRGVLAELKSHIKFMGTPTQQLYTLFSDEIYESAAANGIQVLLSGFGGDEGVSYNGSGFFEEMAYTKKWDLFLSEMMAKCNLHNKSLFKGYMKYFIERYVPFGKDLKKTYERRNHWKIMKIKGFGYDKEFGRRMDIHARYLEKKGFPDVPDVMRRQYYRLIHPQVSQRLIYAFQAGLKYGFAYTFPLLDKDLLESYLSVPSEYKVANGYGRALFRESLKGIVPDILRLRIEKSGTTIPSVQKRMIKDYDIIKTLILQSKAENRYHFINYDKMLIWQELLRKRQLRNDIPYNPAGFYNSLQILVLQEMERTGEFKSGIYC